MASPTPDSTRHDTNRHETTPSELRADQDALLADLLGTQAVDAPADDAAANTDEPAGSHRTRGGATATAGSRRTGRPRRVRRDGIALRIWSPIRGTLLTVAATLGIVSILGFALLLFFGLKPQIVISGSMEPTMPTGSLALARPVDARTVQKGDIVTVPRNFGDGLVTHRVIAIDTTEDGTTLLTLRGDANKTADPQPYAVSTAGLVVFHIPYLGFVARVLQTGYGIVGLALVGLCFISAFVFDPVRIRRWYAPRPAAS